MPTPPTVTDVEDRDTFDHAMKALESQIANVGAHVTIDSTTRLAYSREIRAMAKTGERCARWADQLDGCVQAGAGD